MGRGFPRKGLQRQVLSHRHTEAQLDADSGCATKSSAGGLSRADAFGNLFVGSGFFRVIPDTSFTQMRIFPARGPDG